MNSDGGLTILTGFWYIDITLRDKVKFPTGGPCARKDMGKSPRVPVALFHLSAVRHIKQSNRDRSGDIPEPTVKVRMREEG